jgi:GNAT superfamily N-acetyltransferase
MCELYLDPDVNEVRMAIVEQVGTLPAYRERGLAKAVVCEAIAAARGWGAKLIMVPPMPTIGPRSSTPPWLRDGGKLRSSSRCAADAPDRL